MEANREDDLENSDEVAPESSDESEDDENGSNSSDSGANKIDEDVEENSNIEEKKNSNILEAEDSSIEKIESDEERSIDKVIQSPDIQSENSSEKYGNNEPSPMSESCEGIGDDQLQTQTELHKESKEIDKSQEEMLIPAARTSEAEDKNTPSVSDSVLKTAEPSPEPRVQKKVESLKKEISKNVEDQEAELDFEEEVNDDRKDESEMDEKQVVDKETIKSDSEEVKEKQHTDGDGDDDGELEDDDDLEEGEVKDTSSSSSRKAPNKPICRFYNKGQCTWGSACRFIHPGVNDRGNYNMFSSSKPLVPSNNMGLGVGGMMPGPPGRGHSGWRDVILPPMPVDDTPPVESAWERGLRHAKEILKKANRRKEMEPDFEEKRLNLSLGASECSPEFEKENDFYCKSPYKKTADPVYTFGYDDPDPLDRQAQEYWRGGNYENFEVRYLRNDYDYRSDGKDKDKDKDRSRRDKFENARLQDHNWRDNRYAEVQVNTRGRDDEWKDPWRRSTSPKRGGRSKSYSSASSASSCTSRSSHTTYSSHTRSSSASSFSSESRSQSRKHRTAPPNSSSTSNVNPPAKKKSTQSHAQTPVKASRLVEKKISSPPPPLMPQVTAEKKKKSSDKQTLPPAPKSKRPRSFSSGSSTTRSRNSSKGSISSRSSSRSSSVSSISDYERKANGVNRKPEKGVKVHDKAKGKNKNVAKKYADERETNEHDRKAGQQLDSRVKSAVSSTRASKDPLKQSGLKPQIKLTLLNKQQPDKASSAIPKKDNITVVKAKPPVQEKDNKFSMKIPMSASKAKALAMSKPDSKVFGEKNMDDSEPDSEPEDLVIKQPQQNTIIVSTGGLAPTINTVTTSISGKKRPATPPSPPRQNVLIPPKVVPTLTMTNKAGGAKKNTVSRREELLKQLKAVEDAIARKRAKLS